MHVAVGLLLAAAAAAQQGSPGGLGPASVGVGHAEPLPQVITARQATLERNAELRTLVETVHRDADAIVVLSGGPSAKNEARARAVLAMLQAVGTLAAERSIAVGDGGADAGLMQAAGRVRRASARSFPLVGVVPAREIVRGGSPGLGRHHSHLVAVEEPTWLRNRPAWGTETATRYWLFNRFAEGRNSVAIVAGGDAATLDDLAANVEYGRPVVLLEGSGGAVDALITLLRGTTPADGAGQILQDRARQARLARRPDLFSMVPVSSGAAGLLGALRAALGPVLPRTSG